MSRWGRRTLATAVLGAVSIAAPLGTVTHADAEPRVVTTLSVAASSDLDPVMTPDGSAVYLVDSDHNQVHVVDTATDQVRASVPVGNSPGQLAVTPSGAEAYVPNTSDDTVSVISTATDTVTASIPVAGAPWTLAFSPDSTMAYVLGGFGGLTTVSTISRTATASVNLPMVGDQPQVTPDGRSLVMMGWAFDAPSTLMVADTQTLGVSTQPLPLGTPELALSNDGTTAFVLQSMLYAVSLSNLSVTNIVVGNSPADIVVLPGSTTALVSNQGSDTLSVVDTVQNTVSGQIEAVGGPSSMAVAPQGGDVWVSMARTDELGVLSPSATATQSTAVGDGPQAIAVTPDGLKAYVVNSDNTVSVVRDVPDPLPGSPSAVSGVGGNGQATVSWLPSAYPGTSPVVGYTVQARSGGAPVSDAGCSSVTTTCTVPGLVNGTPYTFTVTATNAVGSSPPSAPSAPVTPLAPPPRTQTLRRCGELPNRMKRTGRTRLLRAPCTTSARQRVSVRAMAVPRGKRASVRFRLITRNGWTQLITYGDPMLVTVMLQAPATPGYQSLATTRRYRVTRASVPQSKRSHR